jgi:hypothetical protein
MGLSGTADIVRYVAAHGLVQQREPHVSYA